MGIPRLVIGFTVVTFGTASPELTVSHDSALSGQGDIALGNVVGSSIFNILAVLGPLTVATLLTFTVRAVRNRGKKPS